MLVFVAQTGRVRSLSLQGQTQPDITVDEAAVASKPHADVLVKLQHGIGCMTMSPLCCLHTMLS